MFNANFYPTPKHLIARMVGKVSRWGKIRSILEPSAGMGDIIDYLNDRDNDCWRYRKEISAIEIEPRLQDVLRSKDIKLVDSNFLEYEGGEHFDLIIANFPFSDGDKHLLKALDILFSGEIVCLINSETLKNPCTNSRKLLVRRLEELGADIEYIEGAFKHAERKSNVEVALIHIKIDNTVETEIFASMKEDSSNIGEIEERKLQKLDSIDSLVESYNREKEAVIKQIINYYSNYQCVAQYVSLVIGESKSEEGSLTEIMKKKVNAFIKLLKEKYWGRVTELQEIRSRLTSTKRGEIAAAVKKYHGMAFTENNIRQFAINIIKQYPKMIEESIQHLFDEFTRYALTEYWGKSYSKNIHYFNGWKTNDAFRVNKKVIIPFYQEWSFNDKLRVSWKQKEMLNDIDQVINYFNPSTDKKESTAETVERSLEKEGVNRKIETDLFYISIYKKGTMHLEFRKEEILRRFNIEACKGKEFLHHDYASRSFKDLTDKEKDVVRSFEGEKNYRTIESCIVPRILKPQNNLLSFAG